MAKRSEAVQLQGDIKSLAREVQVAHNERDYYRGQLQASGDAWSKKYLALEENSLKIAQTLTAEAMNFVREQSWKHELKTEQARTETITQCFKHVAGLLTRG